MSSVPSTCQLAAALALASLVAAGCSAPPAARPTPAAPSAGGLRVYRDPVTGLFTEPPAQGAAAPQRLAPTVPAGLVEEPAPGGGTMVRLNGAFRSHFTARPGAAGVDVSCGTTAAPR